MFQKMKNIDTAFSYVRMASDAHHDINLRKRGENGEKRQEQLGNALFNIYGRRGRLNPRFVVQLMFFPKDWTERPFRDGKTTA